MLLFIKDIIVLVLGGRLLAKFKGRRPFLFLLPLFLLSELFLAISALATRILVPLVENVMLSLLVEPPLFIDIVYSLIISLSKRQR